ncbi:MAG: helix-turn-helix transcriptional regulator [Anaerolineales bacterium]|nr:helix-turn-helix transcriptional regulator [Anaerolineales bacterium]
MTTISPEERIANLFRNVSQPERIRILLTIGNGEACVCHLEARLGLRQAYISQHLMAMREWQILDARRDGRFIYYRLANPELLDLIREAGRVLGVTEAQLEDAYIKAMGDSCSCPKCNEEAAKPSTCNRAPSSVIHVSEVI